MNADQISDLWSQLHRPISSPWWRSLEGIDAYCTLKLELLAPPCQAAKAQPRFARIRMDQRRSNIYEYLISDQLGVDQISKKALRLPVCQGFGITMRWEQFLCSSAACCRANQLAQRLSHQVQCSIARRESEWILRVVRSCLLLLCGKQRKASLWK